MIKNYFQTAWKSLKKNKFFSSLNILGLAIGMAVFMLIAQYVHFERSYENFISGKEDIYRVSLSTYRSNELISASAENYPGVLTEQMCTFGRPDPTFVYSNPQPNRPVHTNC